MLIIQKLINIEASDLFYFSLSLMKSYLLGPTMSLPHPRTPNQNTKSVLVSSGVLLLCVRVQVKYAAAAMRYLLFIVLISKSNSC